MVCVVAWRVTRSWNTTGRNAPSPPALMSPPATSTRRFNKGATSPIQDSDTPLKTRKVCLYLPCFNSIRGMLACLLFKASCVVKVVLLGNVFNYILSD